jgi:hypothetical protein
VANAGQVAFGGFAAGIGQAAAEMISLALTFWVLQPSVIPEDDVILRLQGLLMPVVAAILTGSVLWQSIRMVLSRKKDPLINIGVGLLRFVVTNALALTVIGLLLQAGDALALSLVTQGIADYAQRMGSVFGVLAATQPVAVLFLGVIALILGALQALGMVFRLGGLLVLAVLIVLAASGSLNEGTKPWLPKVAGWMLALAAYKPAAAMIYTIGFTFMGTGQDLNTILIGMAILVLAIVALPVMLKFFSFASVAVSGGSGLGAGIATGALGAVTVASLMGRGGGQGVETNGPGTSSAGQRANPGGAGGAASGGGGSPWPTGPNDDNDDNRSTPGGGWGGGGGNGAGGAGGGAAGVGARTAPGAAAAAGSAVGGGQAAGAAAAGAGPVGAGVAAAGRVVGGAQQAARGAAHAMGGAPPPDQPPPRTAPGARR